MMRARILLAASLAAIGMWGCGGAGTPDVLAYFTDVGDLVPGANVQMSDVEIGTVTDIELVTKEGSMVAKVTLDIDDGHTIVAGDLAAVVRQTSLLGEQFVELVPSAETGPVVGGATVTIPLDRTDRRVDVETFLADLSGFIGQGGLEDLNRFTHAQALILEDRGARFGQTITELERFTSVLADRRLDIGAAIDELGSAATTIAANRATLDSFLDSLRDANQLLAGEGDRLGALFRSLRRFGDVNARFLARHESAINRQFVALRPIFEGLAGAQGELRRDISQLRTFFDLFPKSMGGGPGGRGHGDYTQADAVLCESLAACHTNGERGDVPGQGS